HQEEGCEGAVGREGGQDGSQGRGQRRASGRKGTQGRQEEGSSEEKDINLAFELEKPGTGRVFSWRQELCDRGDGAAIRSAPLFTLWVLPVPSYRAPVRLE